MRRLREPRASCRWRPARLRDPAIMRARILPRCARREKPNWRRQPDKPMPKHHEMGPLPYTPEQMFDLVANVDADPEFLPWVSAIRVRSDSDSEMVADMIVGFKGIKESFTSRVHKHRPDHVRVDYLDGPLKHLHNEW